MIDISIFQNSLGRIQKYKYLTPKQKEIYDVLMNDERFPTSWGFKDRIEYIRLGLTQIPVCETCKKPVNYKQHLSNFPKYCSRQCAGKSPTAIEARKKFKEKNPNFSVIFNTIKKYGKNAMQIDEFREKSISKRSKHRNYLTKDWFIENYVNTDLTQYDLSEKFGIPQPCISDYMRKFNIDPKKYSIHSSKYEEKIYEVLQSYGILVEKNVRNIITPYEIDIYVPDAKLGIEVNGIYWHSNLFTEPNYHQQKMRICREKRIQLLQFWDIEVKNKFDIVISMILHKLGYTSKKIGARNLQIKEIMAREARNFFEENHLKGFANSSKHIALVDNDNKIMACLSVSKSRFSKSNDFYEIVRFATKKGISVPGALSKLVKYLNASVISYVDLMIGNGESYFKSGFRILRETPPSPWFFHKSSDKLLHRISVQKHKLKTLLENFDERKTYLENLFLNGWLWVYDAGTLVVEFKVHK